MSEILTTCHPPGWSLNRLGQVFEERKHKASDKDFGALSVTMQGIVPQLETAAKTDDGDNRKLVRKGDYVINSRSDRKGASGISPYDGTVSLISIVLKPRLSFIEDAAHGTKKLRSEALLGLKFPLPPLVEQQDICARYEATRTRTESLLAAMTKSVDRLREYRAALITAAVTGQIDAESYARRGGADRDLERIEEEIAS